MKKCKKCGCEHDGSYGSGEFCSSFCARSYSSSINKNKTKPSFCIKCNKEIEIPINCSHKFSKCEQCKIEEHKCSYGCGNDAKYKLSNGKFCCSLHYSSCPKIKEKNSIGSKLAYKNGKTRRFDENDRKKSRETKIKNIKESGIASSKKILIDIFEVEYKCLVCGINSWNNKKIVLELDHKDGNNKNNRIENLRLLCPNCHSQTKNFRSKNIKIYGKKVLDDELIKAIESSYNINQTLLKVGLVNKGGNYDRVKRMIISGKANFLEK